MNITKPTLFVNEAIAKRNIKNMALKAIQNKVLFEPHFKTHQSIEVGNWFKEFGVDSITVSSVSMAQYFSAAGWTNITIAFPFNILEINELNLISSSVNLTLLVEDESTIEKLNSLESEVSLFIEIDAGYHRSGIAHDSYNLIDALIEAIKKTKHTFKGFYYHGGNSYSARSKEEVLTIFDDFQSKMIQLKSRFSAHNPHIAVGDTPTCSLSTQFKGIDSIHPGNFVFYDLTQVEIGSCQLDQIAVSLLCPVVMKSEERKELVIYGGGVHLSKEGLQTKQGLIYGLVGKLNEEGFFSIFPDTYVKSLSQEHGVIVANSGVFNKINIGDVVAIIPIHSCMTVDCMSEIYTYSAIKLCKMDN